MFNVSNSSVDADSAESNPDERIVLVELLLGTTLSISSFMREVVCELLLREVGQLVDRYLRKMRKSFTRMHWGDDDEDLDPTEFMSEAVAGLALG